MEKEKREIDCIYACGMKMATVRTRMGLEVKIRTAKIPIGAFGNPQNFLLEITLEEGKKPVHRVVKK